jgi:hypothetical protein
MASAEARPVTPAPTIATSISVMFDAESVIVPDFRFVARAAARAVRVDRGSC